MQRLLGAAGRRSSASSFPFVTPSLVVVAVSAGLLATGACSGGRPTAGNRPDVNVSAEDDAFAHAIARTGLNPDELVAGFGAPPQPMLSGWHEDGAHGDDAAVIPAAIGSSGSRTQMLRLAVQSMPFGMPLDRLIVMSRFGPRGGRLHAGVDLDAPYGAPVMATAPGIVMRAGWHYGYGKTVDVRHGPRVVTRYAHLSAINVSEGQTIRAGQAVGRLGSTGRTTAPHLHYEVIVDGRPRNPLDFIRTGQAIAVSSGQQTASERPADAASVANVYTSDSRRDVAVAASERRHVRGVRSTTKKSRRVDVASDSRYRTRMPSDKPTRAGRR